MNKRTKQLLVEAGFKMFDGKVAAGGFTSSEKMTENVEKLIELVVKDCSGIYSKIDNGNLHMGTDDYLEALHKTFFGVEE